MWNFAWTVAEATRALMPDVVRSRSRLGSRPIDGSGARQGRKNRCGPLAAVEEVDRPQAAFEVVLQGAGRQCVDLGGRR